MVVVEDFSPLSERKTKADASNSAVMAERAKTRLHSIGLCFDIVNQFVKDVPLPVEFQKHFKPVMD